MWDVALYRLERPERYRKDAAVLEDGDYRIELRIKKGWSQRAVIVATERLTNEPDCRWTLLEAGELCAFHRGKLIFSSAVGIDLCGIEVYILFHLPPVSRVILITRVSAIPLNNAGRYPHAISSRRLRL